MAQKPVLVIENEQAAGTAIANILRSMGMSCDIRRDGNEGLDLIAGGDFEVVVCSIDLPGIGGLEIMEHARKVKPSIPFIMTGDSKDHVRDRIIRDGADDFIEKPFSGVETRSRLERVIREKLASENTRLLNEQKVIKDRLSIILQMSLDLTAGLNFDRLFERITGKMTQVMEAERTSLYLIDWEKREIWTKVAEHIDRIRLPMGEGICGRVAATGETVNVDDAYTLPYFKKDFDSINKFRTRSVLCMPVYNRERKRVAVLQVLNKKNGGRFTSSDEHILEAAASQVAITIENSFLLDELNVSFESSVRTLSATVDARHPLTAGHSQRVTEYSLMIARQMGLDPEELQVIKYAALLHDIGKIGIRDDILLKKGAFTPEERDEMKSHAARTRSILQNFHFPRYLRRVPVIASQHHEKVNGKGYPEGLTGDELSLESKILAVADVFDALTSFRDYFKHFRDEVLGSGPMPLHQVIDILRKNAGTHFDVQVVDAFLACLPQVLRTYRGGHFAPEYVDDTIRELSADFALQEPSLPLAAQS